MTGPLDPSPWWSPSRHADRRPFLLARGRIVRAIRAYFEADGFIEAECGALQRSPGNETHLHALPVTVTAPDGARTPCYLHTSPEFACKKLLAAGETRIFDLARVYRDRERGPLHATEFTMLEWYRAHAPYERVMEDCANLLRLAAQGAPLRWRGLEADAALPPERLTVAEAFERHAGIALFQPRDALAEAARASGLRVAPDDSWPDIFSRILSARVEPHLGVGRATLLYEYPVSEAALARPSARDPRVAERFELYACGVELANGFGELTDPHEQRRRFEAAMNEKERLYGERYPIDQDFLAALAHMPPASGVALGLERLVMLAGGARHIDEVTWTPAP